MLNAWTLREWILAALGPQAVVKHMVAVNTNLTLVKKFGIDPNNAFPFWDWVGGRYSVYTMIYSVVGVLPLSLQYGFEVVEKLLKGASTVDKHIKTAPFEKNLPVILPYSQALDKFAPRIQHISMESNGKGVSIDGVPLPYEADEIDFGEPGTNGQYSFYQLIHPLWLYCTAGGFPGLGSFRVTIGVVKSQQSVYLCGELVSNHDDLMSNFFAQPDALAYGKMPEQLSQENVT